MLTIKDLKKHIKKRLKKGLKLDLLGFVENKDLSSDVESYFALYGIGCIGYDWINGNNKMKMLIEELKREVQ